MADQRALYTEEALGANHPTKSDVINRHGLIAHENDGQHKLSGFQGSQYAADAEASGAYVITLDPVPAAYFVGMEVNFKANTANTGAATLNVNALGAKTIKKHHDQELGDSDIEAGQIVKVVYDGTNFQMQSQKATDADTIHAFDNLGLTAIVPAASLTVALKGSDGNDPSASNKVTIPFRSPTLTTGTPLFRTVSGALSVVLSSGSTLGFDAAEAGRLYVWAIDNAGTVVLGLSRTADIFPESNLVSTTAEGGAGAADSKTVMYSTAAQTSKACRCIGYIEITTGAVAGEWDNAPTKIQIMGPGVRRTGDIVQVVNIQTGAVANGATTIPRDDTIPQKTEGDQYMSKTITPTSAANKLIIDVCVFAANDTAVVWIAAALFQDVIANALAIGGHLLAGVNYGLPISFRHHMTAGTASLITFNVRIGADAGTITFNGANTARFYGGTYASSITITEVFA